MNLVNNMEKVYLGRIVATHGIKGELRIKSSFSYKKEAFRVGNHLLIDQKSYVIRSYRVHKDFDMVTLGDFTNINDVLFLVGKKVYIEKEELQLESDQVLDQDLMGYTVVSGSGKRGRVLEIFYASPKNKVMRVELDHEILVPVLSPLVVIDSEKKEIKIDSMLEGR